MSEFVIKEHQLNRYLGHTDIVHIPDDVTVIGRRAFYKCTSLITLHLPSSVKKIEPEAFYGCHNLKQIFFTDGLCEIGHRAFWFCSSLEEIDLPSSIMVVGSRSFECCSSLHTVHIDNPGCEIDEYAFNETTYWHKALKQAALCLPGADTTHCPKELRLPEGITHIDIWSYAGSNIRRAWLPNSLRTIGMCSFKDCKYLKEISMTPNVYCNYRLEPGPSDGIFSGCEQLETIELRGELKHFVWYDSKHPEFLKGFHPEKTFMRCTRLKRIIAWHVPLTSIPTVWHRYALNGYLYDIERNSHYPPEIAVDYERMLATLYSQLLQRTRSDHDYALYEYLMSHHLINEDNFDTILSNASAAESTDLIAALLEYKHTFLNKEDNLWSI